MKIKYKSILYPAFLVFIPIPLYFHLSGRVFNDTGFASAQVLSLSFYLLPILLLAASLSKKNRMNLVDVSMVVLIATMLISFFLSALIQVDDVNINLLVVYLLPQVASYVIGKDSSNYFSLDGISSYLLLSASIFCAIHIAYGFMHYGISALINRGSDDIFGLFSIYQKFISYPLVLAIIIFLSIASSTKYKSLKILIVLFDMLVTASREALLMLITMYLIYFLIKKNIIILFKAFKYTLIVFILGVLLVSFVDISNFWIVTKVLAIFSTENGASNLSAGRGDQVARFFVYLPDVNILFGEGFIISNKFPQGTFHNQWLELFVKGGVFTPLSMLFVFFAVIFKANHLAKFDEYFLLVSVILICLMFISFNINTALRTPYSSILIWVLIGYVSGSSIKKIKYRRR